MASLWLVGQLCIAGKHARAGMASAELHVLMHHKRFAEAVAIEAALLFT